MLEACFPEFVKTLKQQVETEIAKEKNAFKVNQELMIESELEVGAPDSSESGQIDPYNEKRDKSWSKTLSEDLKAKHDPEISVSDTEAGLETQSLASASFSSSIVSTRSFAQEKSQKNNLLTAAHQI